MYWVGIDLGLKSAGNTVDTNPDRINRNAGWHAYGNFHTSSGITYGYFNAYHDLDIHSNHHFCNPSYFHPNSDIHHHDQPIADYYGYPNSHSNEYSHIYTNAQCHPLT